MGILSISTCSRCFFKLYTVNAVLMLAAIPPILIFHQLCKLENKYTINFLNYW